MDRGDSTSTQAIVIGGGIAGCAVALFLHKEGIPVAIYEAYSRERACSEGTVGGGLQIAPNGMNVLNQLGIADRLQAVGVPCHRMVFHTHQGKVLQDARLDEFHPFSHPAVNMKRAMLHLALVEEVERTGIPIHFDKKLKSLEGFDDRDGPVVVRFEDGSEANGDFVIAADGAHSLIRRTLFFENRDQSEGQEEEGLEFLGLMTSGGFVHSDLFVDQPEEEQGTIHFLFGPGGRLVGYCRASAEDPRLVMWWRNMFVGFGGEKPRGESDGYVKQWKGYCPTREELQAIDTEELKSRILDIPGGWTPEVQKLVHDTVTIQRGTIHTSRPLPRWYRGRAVLVGDAAHAVSPHSGQGASQALEDALYLAKVLRVVCGNNNHNKDNEGTMLSLDVLESAFQVYQDGRKQRAESVVEEGRKRGEPRKGLGVREAAPGAVRQWCTEQMVKLVFSLFMASGMRTIFSYSIQLDDCKTLEDIRKKQQQKQGGSGATSLGRLCLVVGVGVVVAGIVMYRKEMLQQ